MISGYVRDLAVSLPPLSRPVAPLRASQVVTESIHDLTALATELKTSTASEPFVDAFVRRIYRGAAALALDLPSGRYTLHHDDAFAWLDRAASASIEAVVTDPPYGLEEYEPDQLEKLRKGEGGIWRIPPTLDGRRRRPAPPLHGPLRHLTKKRCGRGSPLWRERLMRVLVPGAHVFIATNPLVSYLVYEPFITAGFEKRGEIIRIVHTLRGGDRPKNAHEEFADVSVMPRSCWEPWGLFRKPIEGRVQDNLRTWGTGGLRRISDSEPFKDVIASWPARGLERRLSPHPSLKPQHFMRQLTRAALPLERGTLLDPFMGSGSTIAAAAACGLRSIGIEKDPVYHDEAVRAIPKLARLTI